MLNYGNYLLLLLLSLSSLKNATGSFLSDGMNGEPETGSPD